MLMAFLVAWLALNLFTLAWWPPFDFNGDEAWVLDYLLNGGKASMMLGWQTAEKGLLLLDTPLYFAYARLFLWISESIWFLRLSSLLPGLFSLVLVYLIARDEGYPWEGLIAVVILGLSGPFLWTFHYLRWEALTALMGLASAWLFLRGTKGRPFQTGMGGLIAALAVPSHPIGLVFPLGLFLAGLSVQGFSRKIWLWTGLALGAVVFLCSNFLPNIGGSLMPDAFTGLSSRPALLVLFTNPTAVPATLLKVFYKPVMLVASGAEYGSFFLSPILGVLSLCYLLSSSRAKRTMSPPGSVISVLKALSRKIFGRKTSLLLGNDKRTAWLSPAPFKWLWAFILLSFGLLVMRQEYTNILFPFVALFAVLFIGKLRDLGMSVRPWFLLFLLVPEVYLLQGEFRQGRAHLLRRERMIAEVNNLIPPGARVVSSSPALLWGGLEKGYRVFRMADPDYLSGKTSLRDALLRHEIGYLVVDIMPAVPGRSYYAVGLAEKQALEDTALFELLGAFPAGYMLAASSGKDNIVDSFRIYRVK